jgi:hypothetical protein
MASALTDSVTNKRMPPWMPASDCGGPFIGDRSLSPGDIDVFARWEAQGKLEGDPAEAPPSFDAGLPGLPRVDQSLAMTQPYTPRANADDYRCFLLDPANTNVRQITGYDIAPGVRAEVHHVIVYIVNRNAAQQRDAQDATPGWECFGAAGIPNEGAVGAWAPGMPSVVYPEGTGIPLQTGRALAMQIHYNTFNRVPQPDTTQLKLMLAPQGTTLTPAYVLPLVGNGFTIPSMAQGYSFSKDFPNTVRIGSVGIPIKVWGLTPHMHTKGTRVRMTGPNNTCLIDIPRWDFDWQQTYFRPQPFTLDPGQSISMRCTWDNPTTRSITWGEGTDDEMCFAFMYATP